MQGRGTREGRRRLQYERASRDPQPALPDFQAVAFVGTMAGQMIRWGFMGCRSPAWAHGFVTMTPAFVTVGMGGDSIRARVIDQVVLSVVLPVSMLALA
ncbi:divalent metal cation transporter [Burkholderia cenocepacia]|uniref:divalent metal cation transporter n=1 Tax=Burkholderia cenocepacia TaxID=95486 RepID=UPI000F5B3150|nr:divalent metal cation transporter [Burkholderia cenocepacia]MBR8511973.1 divalent metal cation transporter [Burkholderia cenocepacia]RQV49302.1 manganese transporter [Burkholderia cenocepacia]